MKTPEEMRQQTLDVIQQNRGDCEGMHSETDNLMEELLIELGYGEMVKLIRDTTRWYA